MITKCMTCGKQKVKKGEQPISGGESDVSHAICPTCSFATGDYDLRDREDRKEAEKIISDNRAFDWVGEDRVNGDKVKKAFETFAKEVQSENGESGERGHRK